MKKTREPSSLTKESYEEEEGEVIPGLPTCLSFDILSRIPSAKQLTTFKSVSKSWFNSISDPYFISLHSSRSDRYPPSYCLVPIPFDLDRPVCSLLDLDNLARWRELDVEFDVNLHIQTTDHNGQPVAHFTNLIKAHEYPYLSLLPSNKQLVCLSTSYRIYICNPGSQDFIELPKGSGLPFCLYNVGFGYLPCSMEYKVVRLFYTHLDDRDRFRHKLGCEVMTISTCTNNNYEWRVMEEACPYAVHDHGSITVNGFAIWGVDVSFRLDEDEDKNDYILSFDLENEKFGTVPPPRRRKGDDEYSFGLAGLKGDLYFVDYWEGKLIMNMWVLKDWKTFEWSKQYSISFEEQEAWFTRRPLDIIELNGEEVILIYWRGDLHYYHVANKSLELVGYGLEIKFCYYHDSFFSLRSS